MSNIAKKQFIAVLVQFDNPGSNIDEILLPTSTPDEAIAEARKWAARELARWGIEKARLIVREYGEKPVHNELIDLTSF